MVYETYSERKRRLEQAGQPDVYSYDPIPNKLRNQIIHVWTDAFGEGRTDASYQYYASMEKAILRAEGRQSLVGSGSSPVEECRDWLVRCTTDQAIDIIELSARMIGKIYGQQGRVAEINYRFRQNAIGFQFEAGQFIKVDDQFVHAEVVKPAIGLLTSDPSYKAASAEFMTAHQHYREGTNQDAVVAANRAFESTLKAICTKRGWPFDQGSRASDLVKTVRQHGLFPDHLGNAFDSYIAMMKSGLPGIRNNSGGHGPAPNDAKVPDYIAAYAIHLSAANIVVAIEAEKHKR
jgi:AbiJ N-terminal domain 4